MSRRIITEQYQSSKGEINVDDYTGRLLKYIPADVVAAWITVVGLISGADNIPRQTVLWIAFVVGLILAAAWTYRLTSKPDAPPAITQTGIATIAFGVWVFALGGPFAGLSWYDPVYGSLVLILFTLGVPLIVPKV